MLNICTCTAHLLLIYRLQFVFLLQSLAPPPSFHVLVPTVQVKVGLGPLIYNYCRVVCNLTTV